MDAWETDNGATGAGRLSTGTGFFVSTEGHILTNYHVINGCRTAVASTSGMSSSGMISQVGMEIRPRSPANATLGGGKLTVLALDPQNDLALLKSTEISTAVAAFRGGRGVRTGEDIVVTGFPLQGVLASEINVTKGIVSALAGPGNNRGMIQITAPVQPGNSGGPVHDYSGNVVGVVLGKLDADKTRQISGAAPENVNFAISEWAARSFLESHDVQYEMINSNETTPTADIAAKAKQYTVLIRCFK